MDSFEDFCKSENAKNLIKKIEGDIDRWQSLYDLFYFSLDYNGKDPVILNFMTENVNVRDFDKEIK